VRLAGLGAQHGTGFKHCPLSVPAYDGAKQIIGQSFKSFGKICHMEPTIGRNAPGSKSSTRAHFPIPLATILAKHPRAHLSLAIWFIFKSPERAPIVCQGKMISPELELLMLKPFEIGQKVAMLALFAQKRGMVFIDSANITAAHCCNESRANLVVCLNPHRHPTCT